MCPVGLLTKLTGLSSGLCQCHGLLCCGLSPLRLLGLVIKGLAVFAEVALISCIACWKYAVYMVFGLSKYLILDAGTVWPDTVVCK